MHSIVAHLMSHSCQPLLGNSPSLCSGQDILGRGMSLWLVWVTGPDHAPSQLLGVPLHWQGTKKHKEVLE